MFEYKIQEAWENYKEDFGLGRSLIVLSIYNLFLFFLSFTSFKQAVPKALYPIGISLIYFFYRKKIIHFSRPILLTLNIIPLGISIVLNYYLIGVFDRNFGGLTRLDETFYQFDRSLYNGPVSMVFERFFGELGFFGTIIYDIFMLSYVLFFLLSIAGAILYYQSLNDHEKYKIGRFLSSVLILFSLNYIFYLIIPVTGPQYWLKDFYTDYQLPLSSFGKLLWTFINNGQSTFIDCFPSGHTALSYLVCIWLYRAKHPLRYVVIITTLCIIVATLSLRYHYTLDLICAFPLAYISQRISWLIIPTKIKTEKGRLKL